MVIIDYSPWDRDGVVQVGGPQGVRGGQLMIRILLVEDMSMQRRALVALISLEEDIEVIAELDTGAGAADRIMALRPDVAVLDIELPGQDGIAIAEELHRRGCPSRVLILTSLGRPTNLRRAIAAGVHGFLLKDGSPDQLADSIRAVAAGKRAFDPDLTLAALDVVESPLTARETDVLRIAATGCDVDEIASTLHLSTGTVRNYLTTVVHKLGARNRVDAIRIATASGWL